MSLSDTSIEERSIINSLAATISLSAVVFFPPGSLPGMLVFNSDAITRLPKKLVREPVEKSVRS
jgi:hypothetical protein